MVDFHVDRTFEASSKLLVIVLLFQYLHQVPLSEKTYAIPMMFGTDMMDIGRVYIPSK